MPQTQREILEEVAAGRLDPSEAAELLGSSEASADDEPSPGESPPSPRAVNRIDVRASHRRVRLVGDPAVATYAVEGPHHIRRDGDTLQITGETVPLPRSDTWTLLSGGTFRELAEQMQQGIGPHLELTVRIRPDLAVGVEVIAGSVHSKRLPALDHVRVTAGSARVRDVTEPLDLLVQAGSAQVSMQQTHGRSRLRTESGSLNATLVGGTDARLRHDVQLGRFSVQPERLMRDGELTIGTGSAEIDIGVLMGSARVVIQHHGRS
jgi:hypothetical protein